MNANFEKMCRRTGAYSLPWLIWIHDDTDATNLFFVNNTAPVTYGGNTYAATTFSYVPGAEVSGFGGGGSLDITVTDNSLIDMIELYRSLRLDVIGALQKTGDITPVKIFSHHYGTVSWTGKIARFNFEQDDRLDMTFPALVFNSYNCRGVI